MKHTEWKNIPSLEKCMKRISSSSRSSILDAMGVGRSTLCVVYKEFNANQCLCTNLQLLSNFVCWRCVFTLLIYCYLTFAMEFQKANVVRPKYSTCVRTTSFFDIQSKTDFFLWDLNTLTLQAALLTLIDVKPCIWRYR